MLRLSGFTSIQDCYDRRGAEGCHSVTTGGCMYGMQKKYLIIYTIYDIHTLYTIWHYNVFSIYSIYLFHITYCILSINKYIYSSFPESTPMSVNRTHIEWVWVLELWTQLCCAGRSPSGWAIGGSPGGGAWWVLVMSAGWGPRRWEVNHCLKEHSIHQLEMRLTYSGPYLGHCFSIMAMAPKSSRDLSTRRRCCPEEMHRPHSRDQKTAPFQDPRFAIWLVGWRPSPLGWRPSLLGALSCCFLSFISPHDPL